MGGAFTIPSIPSFQSMFDALLGDIVILLNQTIYFTVQGITNYMENTMKPFMTNVIRNPILNQLNTLFTALTNQMGVIGQILQDVKDTVEDTALLVSNYLQDIWQWVQDLPGLILGFLVDVINLISALTTSVMNTLLVALTDVQTMAITVASSVSDIAVLAVDTGMQVVEKGIEGLTGFLETILAAMNQAIVFLGDRIQNLITFALVDVRNVAADVTRATGKVLSQVNQDILVTRALLAGVSLVGGVAAWRISSEVQ